MMHLLVAITLAAAAQAKKKQLAKCPLDSDKFKIHETDVTCATIREESARQAAVHCVLADGPEDSITARKQLSRAYDACPRACKSCEFDAFASGQLQLKAPPLDNAGPVGVRVPGASARLAATYPIARSVVLVDAAPQPRFEDRRKYDALYIHYDEATAAAAWRRGAAALLLDPSTPSLPFAERAADMVVVDLGTPRVRAMTDDQLHDLVLESARVLASDGPLVLLRNRGATAGRRAAALKAWLASEAPVADVCRLPGHHGTCATRKLTRCVSPAALLRPSATFSNVYERVAAPVGLEGACSVADVKSCAAGSGSTLGMRFTAPKGPERSLADATRAALVLKYGDASVGRLRYWDVRAVVANHKGAWADYYSKSNANAWRDNYAGAHGLLRDKREWPADVDRLVRKGEVESILDAGAGTCSLDAHLRAHGQRHKLRLLSFGFYDCSMARVAAERGSLIFDHNWVEPLPLCAGCHFDLVFQAEGMHHTVRELNNAGGHALCHALRRAQRNATGDAADTGRRLLWRRKKKPKPPPRLSHAEGVLAKNVERKSKGIACAHALWQAAFDNLGRHVKCGGYLYVTDYLGVVFDTPWANMNAPACWPAFADRWARQNGFKHVRKQAGDPCGNHYPFLFLTRVGGCPAGGSASASGSGEGPP